MKSEEEESLDEESLDEESLDEEALSEARIELDAGSPEPRLRAFVFACNLDEIPANGSRGKVIFFEHEEVALFNIRGDVFAISNICPHQLSPLLSEGHIDKDFLTVTCPLHGWTYNLATGASILGDSSIPSYSVRVEGQEVWIEEPKNG